MEYYDKEEQCKYCGYFIQHYIRDGIHLYTECNAGHCIHGKKRGRRPGDHCDNFTKKEKTWKEDILQ